MKTIKSIFVVVILFSLFIVFYGCKKDDTYKEFVRNFDELYYKVAQSIDIEHTLDSIKKLQTEENSKNIEKMGQLLSNINNNVPNGKYKHYKQLCKQYEGIVFLRDAYRKWDKLTKDEKQQINVEMLWAYDLYQDKNKE